jgi:hypothetical protein
MHNNAHFSVNGGYPGAKCVNYITFLRKNITYTLPEREESDYLPEFECVNTITK